jgi:hypothetical protein
MGSVLYICNYIHTYIAFTQRRKLNPALLNLFGTHQTPIDHAVRAGSYHGNFVQQQVCMCDVF